MPSSRFVTFGYIWSHLVTFSSYFGHIRWHLQVEMEQLDHEKPKRPNRPRKRPTAPRRRPKVFGGELLHAPPQQQQLTRPRYAVLPISGVPFPGSTPSEGFSFSKDDFLFPMFPGKIFLPFLWLFYGIFCVKNGYFWDLLCENFGYFLANQSLGDYNLEFFVF